MTEHQHETWEYRLVTVEQGKLSGTYVSSGRANSFETLLEQWGADGWELVTAMADEPRLQYIFKRPKRQSPS